MENLNMSPVLQKKNETMSFPDAIKEIAGKKIRRLEWPADEYGALVDGWLIVHRQGVDHRWLVSQADMEACDWITLSESKEVN